VALTIPPWGEGGLFDSFAGAGAGAGGRWHGDENGEDDVDMRGGENPPPAQTARLVGGGGGGWAEGGKDDDAGAGPLWMAAAAAAGGGAGCAETATAAAVLGWDAAPAKKPACGAFMSRGEAAFGRAYNRHLRPVAGLFGAAPAAVAVEEEAGTKSRVYFP